MGYAPQNIGGLEQIRGDAFDVDRDTLDHAGQHIQHLCIIFPEDTSLTFSMTAHVNPHVWSAWAEIVDSAATTFSSMITSDAHISAVAIEATDAANEIWMMEIAYGATHIPVGSCRFVSQSIGSLELVQFFPIHTRHIEAGETVYYRLMCSNGGQICQLHLRYYFVEE